MTRNYHSNDLILDAAGQLLLERGAKATTVDAIARASRAPKGSIYYRFKSRDEIFARLWLRSVTRFQQALLAPEKSHDPLEATVEAALAVYDFCAEQRIDARLLGSFRHQDVLQRSQSPDTRSQLRSLNGSIMEAQESLARRLYGDASEEACQRLSLVVFDLPYGVARGYVMRNKPLPAALRADLELAVRAVLTAPLHRP